MILGNCALLLRLANTVISRFVQERVIQTDHFLSESGKNQSAGCRYVLKARTHRC